MNLPRLITRRRVKWSGTVLIIAILSVTLASMRYTLWVALGGQGQLVQIWLGEGAWYSRTNIPLPVDRRGSWGIVGPTIQRTSHRSSRPMFAWASYDKTHFYGVDHMVEVVFPLWALALPLLIPTAYLWYTDRRAKPWQCPKCRYDLHGLGGVRRESGEVDSENRRTGGNGVCPECGRVIDHSNRGEPSAD